MHKGWLTGKIERAWDPDGMAKPQFQCPLSTYPELCLWEKKTSWPSLHLECISDTEGMNDKSNPDSTLENYEWA